MKKRLEYTIGREAANIQREPFVVSSDSKNLHITMNVPEECRFMGYAVLEDPKGNIRLQKLLGYGDHNLSIGETGLVTSVGGVPGFIEAGTWNLILGIFTEYVQQKLGDKKVLIEACITDWTEVTAEPVGNWVWTKESKLQIDENKYNWNRQYVSEPGWFKGDFHTHTTLSDGKETKESAMEKAELTQLDFYVPTEHNLFHTGWCDTTLCILPGTEITTDQGHFNLFGVTEIPKRLMDILTCNGKADIGPYVREIMQEARQKNWIISLNHPFLTIWSWRLAETRIDEFDCVEIVNDPTYPDAPVSNGNAIRFLDALWEDGHRIFGVGGSDSHNLLEEYYEGADAPSIAGDPGTYVYCEYLSPAELMKQVKRGHICVSRHCRIEPAITMDGKSYLPGDELAMKTEAADMLTGQFNYSMKITEIKEEPVVHLIQNGSAISVPVTVDLEGSFNAQASVIVNPREWTWIRMDIRRKNGEFLGYINPVFCGEKSSKHQTFGEIVESMGEEKDD